MKTSIKLKTLAIPLLLGLSVPGLSQAAPDCTNTPWKASNGQTCAKLGLDSNKAVCETNHKYATLCDDTPTQIRTCVSDIPCANKKSPKKSIMDGEPGDG